MNETPRAMDKQELISLVRKYLNGKATAEERAFIETWYREMDADYPIETVLSAAEIEEFEQAMFVNIQQRIHKTSIPARPQAIPAIHSQTTPASGAHSLSTPHAHPQTAPVHTIPSVRPHRYIRPLVAAAILLFIISGTYILYYRFSRNETEYATLYTQAGKVSKITLDDGTVIWLNAASNLKFPKAFAKAGPREVFLEGEAYFEVAKDMQHPFLVHTRDLTTKVLGTKFNVKAYTGLSDIEVTLLEGKVMLSAPSTSGRKDDTLYLDPNQRGLFAANGLHAVDDHVATHNPNTAPSLHASDTHAVSSTPSVLSRQAMTDARDDAAWINGQLVFHNATLTSVINTLARKYNINIQSDSTLLDQHITATIDANHSPEEALVEVTHQLKHPDKKKYRLSDDHAQYRKEGNTYYIE